MTPVFSQSESIPDQTLVVLLHAGAAGRIRLKVRGLYRSERLKAELENNLVRRARVRTVNANPLTGNVLVGFAPDEDQAKIIAEVDRLARLYLQSRPAPAVQPPPPSAKPKTGTSWFKLWPTARPKPFAAVAAAPPTELWHTLDKEETLHRLGANEEGLSKDEAERRLLQYGPNRLAENKPRSAIRLFFQQFASVPVGMLGVSAAISVATGGVADAVVIVGVVLINAVIGYVTESTAERTINALGKMTPTRAQVIRAGRQLEIPVEEVVVGDLLVVTPGSYIAADARLVSSSRLTVDESALTGESMPVGKHFDFVGQDDSPLGDRKNMLHMGTIATGGSAQAVVVGTGRHTEIGVIQSLVGEVRPPETPLQKQLDDMGTQLALLSGGICALVFGIGILRGYGWLQMLTSSISLAVAAVPEGLPAVATTTLALGIREMQREQVLIRKLPAVESLGSVQVICLDKTGTLTLNRMKVVTMQIAKQAVSVADDRFEADGESITPLAQEELQRLLQIVCLCSEVKLNGAGDGAELAGSATESALIEAAINAGEDVCALRASFPLLKTVHRAEDRPYMTTVHETGDGRRLFAVKGSPADVLRLCRWRQRDGRLDELDDKIRGEIIGQNNRLAGEALRVLGVAYAYTETPDASMASPPLIWLGLIGMEDSIRAGTETLMVEFHDAGVKTVMITGDQSATAYSVGRRLGLSGDQPLEIIDSTNLDKLDPEILKGVIKNTSVFARVSPAHKLKIVQALQQAGQVVAMTGDGINDGPALKAADIGVAMGEQGTDVARSVSDVVLQDDNLQTMVAAIRQGRTIYSNIRKSLRFLLSTNLSEIEVMLVTTALGLGGGLTPIQLLWINLMTDIFPALALALEPAESDVLKQAPRDPEEPIIRRKDFLRLLKESTVMTAGTMGVYGYSLSRYGAGLQTSTNTFMTLTLAQFFHAISCRSEETTIFDRDRAPNPYLVTAIAGSLAIQALAALAPPLRGLLRLSPLAIADLAVIAAGAGLPFFINETTKRVTFAQHPNGEAHS
ncbi:MAG TPA: cation-transporting P-type ATPase [Methylococcaceae bacterium]|nr:cation-transporting P-type ATPase [Methylococcaceae bacterium]